MALLPQSFRFFTACLILGVLGGFSPGSLFSSHAQVVINEIHYHPVEEDAFDTNGLPVLDLTQDVYEFLELYNTGTSTVNLAGWKLDSGIQFTFPTGTTIPAGGYLVVTHDPARLVAVTEYGLAPQQVLGPYSGALSNDGEELRLKDKNGAVVDAVVYGTSFPWPISANSLGATERWLGFSPKDYQYRGRSLEKIDPVQPGLNIENWRASLFPGNPTPGRVNSVTAAPSQPVRPVATHLRLTQAATGTFPIVSNQPARLEITLSSAIQNKGGSVRVEYFVDAINTNNEPVISLPASVSNGVWVATLPGFPGRSIVRYRVMASQPVEGSSSGETVSWRLAPHQDEFFGWQGYFAMPTRTATGPIYDLFYSTASQQQLAKNLQDNPNNGWNPPLGTLPIGRWNNTEPAVLAYEGRIYDVEIRHSGSFYRRDAGRNSFKIEFPQHGTLNGYRTLLILDKGPENLVGHRIFEEAGFPTSKVRSVQLYVNTSQFPTGRLEIEEHDQLLVQRWLDLEKKLHPENPALGGIGHIYKSSGVTAPAPFGGADGSILPPSGGWTSLQRYEWVYSSKTQDWEGYTPLAEMLEELWAARGPGPDVNIPALRAYLESKWDVNMSLDYLALRGWMSVQDDTYHNFFVWKRADGKWTMLAWDFDAEMENTIQTFFEAENANWFKDSFFKAFRQEYIDRLWWLNNTFFHPDNLASQGIVHPRLKTFAPSRIDFINRETGKGAFVRPDRPSTVYPRGGESVVGGAKLKASPYSHPGSPPLPHASTWWAIRTADGSYRDPVFSVTNIGPSTEITIPVERLKAGVTYYWQCVYHDSIGRPSTPAQETAFVLGGRQQPVELVKLVGDEGWTYNDAGVDLAKTWRPLAFDDSTWKRGASPFGVSTGAVPYILNTPVAVGPRTHYFRRKFFMPSAGSLVELRLQPYVDDGAVFYINNVEVLRLNMPTFYPVGSVPFTALAVKDVGTPSLDPQLVLTLNNVVAGTNILAVEIHQSSTNSPDVAMGVILETTLRSPELSGVRINEILALPDAASPHPGRQRAGVELINTSSVERSLEGWTLTDDSTEPNRYTFPASVVLAPGERRAFALDPTQPASGFNVPIALSADRAELFLFQPNARSSVLEVDRVQYGPQIAGASIGRVPDGTGSWVLNEPSLGSENHATPVVEPAYLRINEWMADPSKGSDWLELFNAAAVPVAIGNCSFVDVPYGIPEATFPPLSFLPAYSFTVMIADGNPERGPLHLPFKLSSYGERIILLDSTGRVVDDLEFGKQTIGVSQGRFPDGAATLQDFAGAPTPGFSNTADQDQDGMPDDWERANNLKPGVNDRDEDPDRDGSTNYEEYLAGTLPRNPTSVLRLELLGGDGLRMGFTAVAGKLYQLERSGGSLEAWESIMTVPAQSVTRPIVIDGVLNPGGAGSQFYRVRLLAP